VIAPVIASITRLAPAAPVSVPITYVKYLHLFRGLAILQIVMIHAGHVFLLRGFSKAIPDTNPVYATVDVLFHGSTIYFAMMSGILYAHLFWRRDFFTYLKGRAANVATPYITMSIALTTLIWVASWRRNGEAPDWALLAHKVLSNLISGDAWNTFWYIPVILILYLLSPLLFTAVRTAKWRFLALVTILLPLIVSRTGTELTAQMLVYFAGAYTFGLFIGLDLDGALDRIEQNITWLILIAMVSTATLMVVFLSGFDPIGPISLRESLFYIQKLSLACLMLAGLRAWDQRPGRIRDTILGLAASTSFGIYFLHGPLMRPVVSIIGPLAPADQPWWALCAGILTTFAAGLVLSLSVIFVCRSVVGQRSRQLIGA
jgi:peptidoglycan/LPS O-acetylase OafA/YrhL